MAVVGAGVEESTSILPKSVMVSSVDLGPLSVVAGEFCGGSRMDEEAVKGRLLGVALEI